MNTREVTRQYRLNQWTKIIRECRSSGLTVSTWCAEHNINTKSYYYWLKRVREAACEALPPLCTGDSRIVPVNISESSRVTGPENEGTTPDILIRFGSLTLELHNNASSTLIENTLRALQNVR